MVKCNKCGKVVCSEYTIKNNEGNLCGKCQHKETQPGCIERQVNDEA